MSGMSSAAGPPGETPKPNLHPRRGGRRTVPTVLQMERTECGAACLAMILAHYGKWMPLEELRVLCGVSRGGTKASNIIRTANDLGMVTRSVWAESRHLVGLRFPMIVYWNFNHFVVLEGFRRNRVYISDPAEGKRTLSIAELDANYSGVCLLFQPGPEFRTGGKRPSALRGLISRLGHARAPLLYVVLATLMLIVPGLALPTLLKVFVDDVLIPRSDMLVFSLMVGLGLVACLQAALTWLQQVCLARMETKLAVVATTRFFVHLFTLPMIFFNQRFAGDIADRVASNDRVAQMLSGDLATGAVNALTMAAYGGVMLSYDPTLALAVFGAVLLNVLALRVIAQAREDGSRRLLKERAKVAAMSIGGLNRIETLKGSGSENAFLAEWSGQHVRAVAAQQSLSELTGLLNVVPPLLSSLTTVAILGFGGYRVLEGMLSIGGLVAFQSLAHSFAKPIEKLVQFSANLQTIQGDIGRIDDVLNHSQDAHVRGIGEAAAATEAPKVGRGLRLENLTFGYTAMEPPVVEDFSLEVQPGRKVALVGRSGCGKTTVGKLACRLLDPWSGSVQIGGVDVGRIASDRLSSIVSYVSQDIVLFDGTVRDNVTLWNPNIDERMVTQALRDAAVLDAVTSRPGNYDAPVGEDGRNFSGGQRQLLELARSLVSSPDILVLDEATAALDPITEALINDNLSRRGMACLVIAHRLSTVRDADEIIVLDHGRIAERGTHDQLLAHDGLYASLVGFRERR